MQELLIKDEIENMIYEVRGKQVMLDSDLAQLFKYETFNLNKAVSRNINKFSENYMFVLNKEEYDNLIFHFGISKRHGGRRYNPKVFTEKGILMLATILKSDIAIEMSIKIIDVFVNMRKYINNSNDILMNIETKLIEHDNQLLKHNDNFNKIFDILDSKEKINHIFFEGQIYDAYSLLIDILNCAKEEIIIIDNYASKELFDILKDIKVDIKIITKNIDEILLRKYKKQYKNIETINNNTFHDRFIMIDKKILYHSGASFKDLGNKCFGINKIEDKYILNSIIESVGK